MKKSLFKKLIGVGLAVAITIGSIATWSATTAQAKTKAKKVKEYVTYTLGSDVNALAYDDYTEWMIDRVTIGGNIDIFSKAEKIPTDEIKDRPRSMGGETFKNTDLSKYESILCLIRTDIEPEKICGYAVGYYPDGTAEIIYNDEGYNCMGYNSEGWSSDSDDALNWQGFDREGYHVSGFNDEGHSRDGYDLSGNLIYTGLANSDIYYYLDFDELKPFSYTHAKKKATKEGWIFFKNDDKDGYELLANNGKKKLFYKITVSGLKNSNYVIPSIANCTCLQEQGDYAAYDSWFYAPERHWGSYSGFYFSCVPVKNGKATFYTEMNEISRIKWEYQNKEKNVHVSVVPVTREDIKKGTTFNASKRLVLKSNDKYSYATMTANEPMRLITGKKNYKVGLMDYNIEAYYDMKTGKIKFGWMGFCGQKDGTLTAKGVYSGKTIKIKVTDISKKLPN